MRTNAVLFLLTAALAAAGCSSYARFGMESRAASMYRIDRQAEEEFAAALELVAELQYDEAAAKLFPLIAKFKSAGSPPRAAEAVFWTGYCHEKQGHADEARQFYDLVLREYPGTPASSQAAERLARLE